MQYTYWDFFSSKQFLNSWILMPLELLPFFVSPLPHRQNVSLWGLFHCGKQKKVTQVEISWIGRLGHRGHAVFGQKLLNTQHSVGRCTHKSPIMMGKSLQKKFTEAGTRLSQQRQLVHCTDEFLEHSPSGRRLYYKDLTLQKRILLFFWGGPLLYVLLIF